MNVTVRDGTRVLSTVSDPSTMMMATVIISVLECRRGLVSFNPLHRAPYSTDMEAVAQRTERVSLREQSQEIAEPGSDPL